MAADRIGACLLDVSREEAGRVLKPEFRARGSDPEHAGDRDDRDDRERDNHLRDGEAALLRGCSAVGFHLRDYLRQVNPWSTMGKRCSGGDYVQICEFYEGSQAVGAATCYF